MHSIALDAKQAGPRGFKHLIEEQTPGALAHAPTRKETIECHKATLFFLNPLPIVLLFASTQGATTNRGCGSGARPVFSKR
jgi:hypothetical protein